MGQTHSISEQDMESVLNYECSASRIARGIKDREYKKIVVLTGAGISVSCGIPDFRTPGTGLYSNLEKFGLPSPESVFELSYFLDTDGAAFYKLAQELWPDQFKPSPAHLFIRLLHEKGLLLRCYTQNIDTLERRAGIPGESIVEAHGSFASSTCTTCSHYFDIEQFRKRVVSGEVPIRCVRPDCNGLVKPDIVFFGESMPKKFLKNYARDMSNADLLIVMGTSLTVMPFAQLIDKVSPHCPRLLLNLKPVGVRGPGTSGSGLLLKQPDNYRDAMIEGLCDDAVRAICDELGWRDDLEFFIEKYESVGGSHRHPIDLAKAFPLMTPNGLGYNWRRENLSTRSLPNPIPPIIRSQDEAAAELGKLTDDEHDAASLLVFEDESKIRQGGYVSGVLRLTGQPHHEWNPSHCLSLIDCEEIDFSLESMQNVEFLRDPMAKDGQSSDTSFHFFSFRFPKANVGTRVYILYIDVSRGLFPFRWGPFELDVAAPSEEADDDDDNSDVFDMKDLQDILDFSEIEYS